MNLQLGQIVVATRTTAVCDEGERGIVYEIYDRSGYDFEGGYGASIIFERGSYDGFSQKEQDMMLKVIEPAEFCPFGRSYRFRNVIQVSRDFAAGRFNFHPEAARV